MQNSATQRRSLWSLTVSALVSLVVGTVVILGSEAGQWLEVNDPRPSDVMVVMAGETDHRPAQAVRLLNEGYAPRVVIDVPADANVYGFSELQLAEKYVQALPHADAFSICPIKGLSTREESHDVDRCLKPSDKRILIVTSDFHSRRALSIFRHEFRGRSFSVAAVRDDREFGARWWTHRQWAKTCVYEWMRLLWWEAIERWR